MDPEQQVPVVGSIRGAFLAGLLVVVPLGVTVWVMIALAQFLELAIHLVPKSLQPEALLGRSIPGLGIVLAVSIVFIAGFTAQSFLGRGVVATYEALLLRVPILSSVYSAVKQLLEQLFNSNRGFQQVVLVQWPRHGIWAVGFLTGESEVTGPEPFMNVFLPTTPNPTTGFYAIVPEREVVVTNLTVEEGFKLLMSAGIVSVGQPLELPASAVSSLIAETPTP